MSAAPAMTSPVLLTLPYRSFTMVEPCKWSVQISAVKLSIGSTTGCTITEKAPTRAFSWLKAPTTRTFTFKTLC